jgi:ribosomal protein S6
MKQINSINNYELMVILSSNYTQLEIKERARYYGTRLCELGALNIKLISRGCRKFNYIIKGSMTGYFIEVYFKASPQILPLYLTKLKLDKNIIRFTIKNISKK